MFYLILAGIAAGAVVLDQVTKQLVLRNIPLFGRVEALPGVVHWTYVRNEGAAFSTLWGQRWLFVVIFALFFGILVWLLVTRRVPLKKAEYFALAAIFGGGLGNIIDRVAYGYVVDMIALDFFKIPWPSFSGGLSFSWQPFPVFNVADCFITCGVIFLLLHILICNKALWKEPGEKQ